MVEASKSRHVIASTRPWNKQLAERLNSKRLGAFSFISQPSELTPEKLAALDPEYVFFPHWSHMIPKEIHDRFECVIFHMTDLPFGRGGSPLQNLILRGFKDTYISALKCEAGIDAGPVFLKKRLSLEGSAQEIFERADRLIEEMILTICEDSLEAKPQVGEVTHFRRRTPQESLLPYGLDDAGLFDYIRMLDADGYPHAFIEFGERRLEFRNAKFEAGELTATVRFGKKGSTSDQNR